MLIISRKIDEEICIGDNIVVSLVDIRGDKVRLGITASKEIPVHRKEVYEGIQRGGVRNDERASERFERYLNSGEYIDAKRVMNEHNYKPTNEQLIILEEGLKGLEEKINL
jgi:carbon storage regulator